MCKEKVWKSLQLNYTATKLPSVRFFRSMIVTQKKGKYIIFYMKSIGKYHMKKRKPLFEKYILFDYFVY